MAQDHVRLATGHSVVIQREHAADGGRNAENFKIISGHQLAAFVPLMMTSRVTLDSTGLEEWNDYWVKVLARRNSGVSDQQLAAGLNTVYGPLLQEQLPKTSPRWDEKKNARLFWPKRFF